MIEKEKKMFHNDTNEYKPRIEERVECYLNKLGDKELNKLALHLNHPNGKNGNQAPLGVTVTEQQRNNFIKWIKQTGRLDKSGIYLKIIADPDLPARKKEAERKQKLDQTMIDQADTAKKQFKITRIALVVSIIMIIISIIKLLLK